VPNGNLPFNAHPVSFACAVALGHCVAAARVREFSGYETGITIQKNIAPAIAKFRMAGYSMTDLLV
jgi:hypothetical protein